MAALVFNDLAQLKDAMPQKAHLVGAPDKRVCAALAAGFSGLDDLLGIHDDHQKNKTAANATPIMSASKKSSAASARSDGFIDPPKSSVRCAAQLQG